MNREGTIRIESTASVAGAAREHGSAATKRLPALDGLRGIAVLMVVVFHYYVSAPGAGGTANEVLQRLGSLFFCGVDLFFVLSGFLIGGILLDGRDSKSLLTAFYARRFFRIVPLYFALLASYFVCRTIPGLNALRNGMVFGSSLPEWSFPTFTQNIFMALHRDPRPFWLTPTWSLAIEEQFYLLIPFVVIRATPVQLVRTCIAGLLLAPALRTLALVYANNPLAGVLLLPTHADGLLCGLLCAVAARHAGVTRALATRQRMFAFWLGTATLWLGVLAWQRPAPISPLMIFAGYSIISLYFAAVLLYLVICPPDWIGRIMSLRALTAAGIGSYCIYLFHSPLWFLLHWLFRGAAPANADLRGAGVTCLAFLATLVLAWFSWRAFEAPLLRIGRRFSYR